MNFQELLISQSEFYFTLPEQKHCVHWQNKTDDFHIFKNKHSGKYNFCLNYKDVNHLSYKYGLSSEEASDLDWDAITLKKPQQDTLSQAKDQALLLLKKHLTSKAFEEIDTSMKKNHARKFILTSTIHQEQNISTHFEIGGNHKNWQINKAVLNYLYDFNKQFKLFDQEIERLSQKFKTRRDITVAMISFLSQHIDIVFHYHYKENTEQYYADKKLLVTNPSDYALVCAYSENIVYPWFLIFVKPEIDLSTTLS